MKSFLSSIRKLHHHGTKDKSLGHRQQFHHQCLQARRYDYPTDRLDETFTDIRINDVAGGNEDAEDDEPDTPAAKGTSFEDIDRAVKSVRKPEADEEEQLHAGKTFKDIAETELFQKLTDSFSGISDRVNEVIDLYTARAAEAKPLVLPARIEDFDIRDFV